MKAALIFAAQITTFYLHLRDAVRMETWLTVNRPGKRNDLSSWRIAAQALH
jgi:hypothetical protein